MIEKNIVYSTDVGNFCPKCEKKIYKCICSNRTKNYMCSRPIFIEKQTAGRRGKPVNVIKNVPLQKADLKKLAKELRKILESEGHVLTEKLSYRGLTRIE